MREKNNCMDSDPVYKEDVRLRPRLLRISMCIPNLRINYLLVFQLLHSKKGSGIPIKQQHTLTLETNLINFTRRKLLSPFLLRFTNFF